MCRTGSSFPRKLLQTRHSRESSSRLVIPAKAGIHLLPTIFLLSSHSEIDNMDSRFRGNDDCRRIPAFAGMTIADGFPASRE
jgi:hypothetical protein